MLRVVPVWLVVTVGAVCVSLAVNPGAKGRLTQYGLNYANRVAQEVLKTFLQNLTIPDISGNQGSLKYSLKNIHSKSVSDIVSNVAFTPAENGLTIELKQFGIDVYTDYDLTYKVLFIPISASGGLNAKISDSSISLTVGLGVDSQSRPDIVSRRCSANIGSFSLEFKDSNLMNLIKGLFQNNLKSKLMEEICPFLEKEINENINAKVKTMPLTAEFANTFVIDYRLVAPLTIASSYLESSHKGEVFWKNDLITECPFTPNPLPDGVDNSKMVYLWLSDYLLRSFVYVAHTHDYLQYTISKDTLPESIKHYLDTSCSSKCAGIFMPKIGEAFPQSQLEVTIKSTSVPDVSLSDQLYVSLLGQVNISARLPSGDLKFLISAKMALSMSGNVNIQNNSISGNIYDFEVKLADVISNIKTVTVNQVTDFLESGLNILVIPEIKAIAKSGIKVPVLTDLVLKSPDVTFVQGAIVLSSDVIYQNIQ
ncbi:lipopolysaccharide-binding protein-like isoform X2 [Biomphalaria glabrata]|uniref:Lipopolysaccharide-binding protein-like isoform X1 n=1 Tax=Biomphalaria glabrata TaxID=6526 RepID=A0A9W3AZU5_BIOGL|nr:lipopolysaccharide-binding protein-like isoform X1 [Biomphalaria glabrata]XP_055892742.1 lipopolysaccharide-binding protein-like isoform X2 [Biomphalaria glabrata]